MTQIEELTLKAKKTIEAYKKTYPNVEMDRDYLPLKITEEWGECLKAHLMLTDRGRQKGKNKAEMKSDFSEEMADVFGYLLAFADSEKVDLPKALEKKWFKHLGNDERSS